MNAAISGWQLVALCVNDRCRGNHRISTAAGESPPTTARIPRWQKPMMGEVRREEAGNRYCIVLLLSLLSGPRQDVCRRIMADVRTDGCPWTHRIGC